MVDTGHFRREWITRTAYTAQPRDEATDLLTRLDNEPDGRRREYASPAERKRGVKMTPHSGGAVATVATPLSKIGCPTQARSFRQVFLA
jgi:hypothetical protein